jgi:hypothetical protein
MAQIKLNTQLLLGVEIIAKPYRLIVFDGANELVCHKVTPSALNRFIQSQTAHLFKGRLQFDKAGDDITVKVNGNDVGVINLKDFVHLITTT